MKAQVKPTIKEFAIVDEDTIILSKVPEVEILAFKDSDEKLRYYILKRKVLKVYPYSLTAKVKLWAIQDGLDSIPKRRHKKRYTKEVAKWVKEEYTEKLKNLTMSEGRILVKLIYRETQITSYQLVKSYRGRFNAFFWQTLAKFYNNDLKTKYDPINDREDMLIEHIILQAKLEGRLN
ncbi:MAG TPA: DUF4294 domain-containing protein [Flavobacteriales bacterium]|nr:DUF4294 domain-containing protein [Flavobacteriales bacterium]HJN63129.1 DUF4294 domain-containing protein [Flavobacteriales bacterium]